MKDNESVDEAALIRRLIWRIMPLLVLCYLAAIIDRSNVGFAKLQMVGDLKLTEVAYGFGASLFFIGYVAFEIPSTYAVHRFGARVWFARIMLTWGISTVLLAFTSSVWMFYLLRFLLGVAEAGFFPGAIFYLTLWFPPKYKTRVLGYLLLGSAFGNMLGSLIGGVLLDLGGTLGLAGWQWIFLVTGFMPIILTAVVLLFLPSTPASVSFLSDREKRWLASEIDKGSVAPEAHGNPLKVLADWRILLFSLVYILILICQYGVGYWLPTVVKGFGVSGTLNGLVSAIPWALSGLALLWVPGRLKQHGLVLTAFTVFALLGSFCFLASSILFSDNWLRFAAVAVGTPCILLLFPYFWALPSNYFKGTHAATAIGAISTIGNLGGFAAQNLMPMVGQATGNPLYSLLVPAACLVTIGIGAALLTFRATPARAI